MRTACTCVHTWDGLLNKLTLKKWVADSSKGVARAKSENPSGSFCNNFKAWFREINRDVAPLGSNSFSFQGNTKIPGQNEFFISSLYQINTRIFFLTIFFFFLLESNSNHLSDSKFYDWLNFIRLRVLSRIIHKGGTRKKGFLELEKLVIQRQVAVTYWSDTFVKSYPLEGGEKFRKPRRLIT